MKGRASQKLAGNNETDEALRKNTRSNTDVSNATDLPPPKKLEVIRGKRGPARLDKPMRGKIDANAYKNGGGIHIKKSHEGLLHKDLGVAKGKKIPAKKLAKAEKSSDPAVRKRAVFAENAKHWKHD